MDESTLQLMSLLVEFLSTETWREARAMVEHHPELLTQAVDAALDLAISTVPGGDTSVAARLEQHQGVLRRCREIGVAAAFEEVAPGSGITQDEEEAGTPDEVRLKLVLVEFVAAPTRDQSRRLIEAHPELLSDSVDAFFEQAIAGVGGIIEQMTPFTDGGRVELEVESLRRRHRLLQRCKKVGVDAAFEELDSLRAEPEEADLRPRLFEFVTVESRREARRVLEEHPKLVSAHAVDTLKRLVEESRGQVPEDIAEELQARLDLLSRCVGSGMATAFEEDRSANPREALELLFELMDRPLLEWPRMLREHPELLGDDAERALDDLIATARADGKASVAAKLEELGTFLRQYRERWAPSPRGEEPAEQDREVSPLASAVSQFLRADSPQASQRVIEEHPELLTEAADQILRYLEAETEQHEDAAGAATLKAQRQLLRLCREVGIARAFEEIRRPSGWRSAGDVEAGIRTALERMDRLGAPEEDKLALRVNAASGFMVRHHATGARDDLDAAIRARHDVVRFAPVDSPDYPHHLNNLGVALAVRYALTNQLKDLEAAVEAHRGAVAACPPGFEDLPGLMTNLGNMLIDRHAHIGNRADLDEAIAVYRSAVEQAGEEADNLSGLLGNLAEGLRKRFTLE